MREMYTLIEGKDAHINECPLCGNNARLWRFSEDMDSPVSHVVMCMYDEGIGPRDGLVNEGCLLMMPPNDFYRPRQIEAINYWNEYAVALIAVRAKSKD